MTHVVGEKCINCKITECADACPVDDCFREGVNFLVIDPNECIDCGACVPVCPVEAIYTEEDLPAAEAEFKEINARCAEAGWPGINEKKDALSEEMGDNTSRRDLLIEEAFSD